MSSLDITMRDLVDTLTNANKSVDMKSIVEDFGGMSLARRDALRRATQAISDAAISHRGFGHSVRLADFDVLKAFVEFAQSEVSLIGIVRRDHTGADDQHTRNSTDIRDRIKE